LNNQEREEYRDLLQRAFPRPGQPPPETDLWPRMLSRLSAAERRLWWLDWVLAATALLWAVAFPQVIPGLLYQL